jgi:hypothetical protein
VIRERRVSKRNVRDGWMDKDGGKQEEEAAAL